MGENLNTKRQTLGQNLTSQHICVCIYIYIHPLPRNDYQNNSVKLILCNCPGAITGFLCRAPKNNSTNIFSCKSPCPVGAPPRSLSWNHRDYREKGLLQDAKIIPQNFYYVIAPGGSYRIFP